LYFFFVHFKTSNLYASAIYTSPTHVKSHANASAVSSTNALLVRKMPAYAKIAVIITKIIMIVSIFIYKPPFFMKRAARGSDTYGGTPKIEPLTEMPENSASVLPKSTASSTAIIEKTNLMPVFSRINAASPLPVTARIVVDAGRDNPRAIMEIKRTSLMNQELLKYRVTTL